MSGDYENMSVFIIFARLVTHAESCINIVRAFRKPPYILHLHSLLVPVGPVKTQGECKNNFDAKQIRDLCEICEIQQNPRHVCFVLRT